MTKALPRSGPRAFVLLIGLCAALGLGTTSANADGGWAYLKSGNHFALMRHALAPGSGDPPEFRIDDCSTQRNLSEEGRAQARRIGDEVRAAGISAARVLSSQWCRCLETAELLGLGPVEPLPALNSFFRQAERGTEQTAAVEAWIAGQSLERPIVLVTHQVNITALTGVYPRSGEVLIVAPDAAGKLTLVERIPTR